MTGMQRPSRNETVRKALAGVAMLFGAVTIFAGTRVLAGADPGYIVFLPLLVYNTAMGVVYVAVGTSGWRNVEHGRIGAIMIFLLNLGVLAGIGLLYLSGGPVALQSVRAMSFRTVMWLLLFLGFSSLGRRKS